MKMFVIVDSIFLQNIDDVSDTSPTLTYTRYFSHLVYQHRALVIDMSLTSKS